MAPFDKSYMTFYWSATNNNNNNMTTYKAPKHVHKVTTRVPKV